MPATARADRRRLFAETMIVLALSLGRSAVYSVLSIIERLTRETRLSDQTSTMNSSVTPDRPWLDFAYQLAENLFPFAYPILCLYLVWRICPPKPSPWASLGIDGSRRGRDVAWGVGLAAAIGIPGLAFYLFARSIGINTNVVPANLTEVWWTIPMYCLAAFMNGVLEEVVMIGYLFARWKQCGWRIESIIVVSALVRGSYHLYQGFGGFIGNLVMGLAMGWFYKKTGRLWPLIIAHTLLDVAAFVGYSLLAGVVGWL
ncbi:type II CAAX endopeptidase family protein [Brooklawnia cerclae]|uniref:Membrane protease YdiL (CAAX protease family) n=2 Tax=Brooklawnia cerclae TaxID=349934 RepID=A0ABX0SB15_9ACTN|nr:membrane protease YdiL (CAAX protease family) [Brooklawnia cerclae]